MARRGRLAASFLCECYLLLELKKLSGLTETESIPAWTANCANLTDRSAPVRKTRPCI